MAKKEYVSSMFDAIAPTYDCLNHLLSMDVDKSWRRKAVRKIMTINPETVADLACGTGDFSIALAKAGVKKILGYDISEGMLEVGRKKVDTEKISLNYGDSENLPLENDSVDAVSVAFGIRNFEHKDKGLQEMFRIIRPDGMACILELSVPENPFLLACYKIYFLHILPFLGGLISGKKSAYKYLPDSVLHFPKPDVFIQMMSDAGFKNIEHKSFTFGLCRMFVGYK